jgi:hypothetical protein
MRVMYNFSLYCQHRMSLIPFIFWYFVSLQFLNKAGTNRIFRVSADVPKKPRLLPNTCTPSARESPASLNIVPSFHLPVFCFYSPASRLLLELEQPSGQVAVNILMPVLGALPLHTMLQRMRCSSSLGNEIQST